MQAPIQKVEKKSTDFSLIFKVLLGVIISYLAYGYFVPQRKVEEVIKPEVKIANNYSQYHPDYRKYVNEVVREVDPEFYQEQLTEQIVTELQEFIQVDLHPKIHFDTGIQYDKGHLGLKNDYQYCIKSDMYKLQHPESIMENYYILSDFAPEELPREIARDFGVDVMPDIYMGMSKSQDSRRLYNISLKTALINSRISRFHHFHPFGKCLFCVFQSSNHVPGKWSMTGKDLVIDNYRRYQNTRKFLHKKQCLETMTFMPPSYRLYDKEECTNFFEHLDSEEYKQRIQKYGIGFIMKAGRDVHRGEGITLMSPEIEQEYRLRYQQGKKCGKIKDIMQAQTYLPNPMLYKGHKIEVRIYFLLISTNPLIIYSQNLAHLRMCGVPFDLTSTKKEVHVCNVALSKQVSTNFVVDFPLEGLHEYLTEIGVINDPRWLEDKIYPQIYRAITHLVRMGEHDFLRDSRVNENFALDFLLDEDSRIWFMENNPNPQILKISEARIKRHYRMFGDMFEIQFNYLRSRFKRIRMLCLRMKQALIDGNYDKSQFTQEFQKINKNYLEPEFQIRKENTYVKIYDENLKGAESFMGNLPGACLEN